MFKLSSLCLLFSKMTFGVFERKNELNSIGCAYNLCSGSDLKWIINTFSEYKPFCMLKVGQFLSSSQHFVSWFKILSKTNYRTNVKEGRKCVLLWNWIVVFLKPIDILLLMVFNKISKCPTWFFCVHCSSSVDCFRNA